ncbi:hypothetical protein JCM19296_3232 [Nonlabens ulvanivorans]|uniref:Uncharacterized protein n=1 Tax=Nonlabens ulvanivorans TaxID=906888 RepID=A0A081DFC8_NONUL|nr:hypothetical protein JCM19296_3232 [Nonlabens ulvanivorans]
MGLYQLLVFKLLNTKSQLTAGIFFAFAKRNYNYLHITKTL